MQSEGSTRVIAGMAGRSGLLDGPTSLFHTPLCLSMLSTRNKLLVCDYGNRLIRGVSFSGATETFDLGTTVLTGFIDYTPTSFCLCSSLSISPMLLLQTYIHFFESFWWYYVHPGFSCGRILAQIISDQIPSLQLLHVDLNVSLISLIDNLLSCDRWYARASIRFIFLHPINTYF